MTFSASNNFGFLNHLLKMFCIVPEGTLNLFQKKAINNLVLEFKKRKVTVIVLFTPIM